MFINAWYILNNLLEHTLVAVYKNVLDHDSLPIQSGILPSLSLAVSQACCIFPVRRRGGTACDSNDMTRKEFFTRDKFRGFELVILIFGCKK